jgi:hypothetical protein
MERLPVPRRPLRGALFAALAGVFVLGLTVAPGAFAGVKGRLCGHA